MSNPWSDAIEPHAPKVVAAFDDAWNNEPNPTAYDKLGLAMRYFTLGARAFSTMPLCKHGVAVWGIENCSGCSLENRIAVDELEERKEAAVAAQEFELVASLRDKIDKLKTVGPGEFPGYNRPFEAELPEGMTSGGLEDLKVEHEAMRLSLLQALVKVGVIDAEAQSAPWDPVTLTHFTGLWLSDAMPWIKQGKSHRELLAAITGLNRELAGWRTELINHLKDHEEKKA